MVFQQTLMGVPELTNVFKFKGVDNRQTLIIEY